MTTLIRRLQGQHSSALRSITLLMIAFFLFSIQDAVIKTFSDRYALMQVVVIRTLFTIPIVYLLLRQSGGLAQLQTNALRTQLVRGFAMFSAYVFFYMGLAAMPFSLMLAIFFSGPLFITALSVPMLGEKVGWRRWLAVLVGFVGVLIAIDPAGSSFDPASIFVVLSALMYAISIISTRKLEDTPQSITAYTTLCYLVGALILSPIIAFIDTSSAHPSIQFLTMRWPAPLLNDLLLIALIAVTWGVGMVMLSSAYRDTDVAVLAPFEYFGIVYGVVFGYVLWQEIPTANMLMGTVLIVGSGLFIIYRENQTTQETVHDQRVG